MIFGEGLVRHDDASPRVPDVTVIVPVKNEAARIETCLASLHAQTLAPIEILVVDGHSRDATVEIAKRFGARILYEEFGSRAGACQVGVEAAQGEFVAFTDADCLPDPGWLERLAARFAPGISGVGGQILNEGDSFWQKAVDSALDTVVGSANSVQGRMFVAPRYVSSISGCNSMYRRADLLAVGGFRTDLVTTEDTELNRRLLARGKLLYIPDAIVHHRHQRGLRDFARRMFQYGYGRGQSLLVGAPLLMPSAAGALVLLVLLWPRTALFVLAGYLAVLFLASVLPAWRHHDLRLLGALPLIFLTEHVEYVAGFWSGLLRSRITRRTRAAAGRGEPD